jgi:ABC-2 type transport system ATP-binding protein
VRKLSLGERIKFELICAMIHSPAILFLDEPTIGLDVPSQYAIHRFIQQLKSQRGTTIILTSHYMADIEALADRVVILMKGRIRLDLTLAQLLEQYQPADAHYVITWREGYEPALAEDIDYTMLNGEMHLTKSDFMKVAPTLDYEHILSLRQTAVSLEEVIFALFTETDTEAANIDAPGSTSTAANEV